MKVLILSNMYPSRDSYFGSFVKEQIAELEEKGIKITKVVKTSKNRVSYLPFFLRGFWYLLFKNYELVHAHYGFHSALPVLIFKRSPLIVTFHGSDALEEPHRNHLYYWLQIITIKKASHIIAVSEEIKATVISKLGAPENKISVISCGVDTGVFKPYKDKEKLRRELGLPEDKPIILFPGPLSYRKGIDIIYRCADALPDAIFLLMGESQIPNPKSQIPNNCILVGPKPHYEVPKWLNSSDIFFLPSRSEGMPVSLLEALACGLPAIVTSVGDVPEIIKEGENGFLIALECLANDKARNIEQIINKINIALKDREVISKNARDSIKRFDKNKIADRIKEVYEGIKGENKN